MKRFIIIGIALVILIFIGIRVWDTLNPVPVIAYTCQASHGVKFRYLCFEKVDQSFFWGSASSKELGTDNFPPDDELPIINRQGDVVFLCSFYICTGKPEQYTISEKLQFSPKPEPRRYSMFYSTINDEKNLAMLCQDAQEMHLCSANFDGTDLKKLTETHTYNDMPSLNNADQIAFVCYPTQNEPNIFLGWFSAESEICAVNWDGSDLVQLTDDEFGNWAPDLNDKGQIAFMCFDENDSEICTINIDGSDLRTLTRNDTDDMLPSINSRGDIAYSCHDGNDWEICLYEQKHNASKQVTDNATGDGHPDLGDSGYIVYECDNWEPEISIYDFRLSGICVVKTDGSSFAHFREGSHPVIDR